MLLHLDTYIGVMWGTRMEVIIEWQRCEECDYWLWPTYYSWGDTHETTFMCTFPIEGGAQPFYKGPSNPAPGSIKYAAQITDADQAACLLLTLAMAERYLS